MLTLRLQCFRKQKHDLLLAQFSVTSACDPRTASVPKGMAIKITLRETSTNISDPIAY